MSKPGKQSKQTLFITNSSDSDPESDIICDKQSAINLIIQKQIDDDLATHDFSNPILHVRNFNKL